MSGFPSIAQVRAAYARRNGIGRKIDLLERFPSPVDREQMYMLASQWQDANAAFEDALLDLLIELGTVDAADCSPQVEDKRLALAIKNLVGSLFHVDNGRESSKKGLACNTAGNVSPTPKEQMMLIEMPDMVRGADLIQGHGGQNVLDTALALDSMSGWFAAHAATVRDAESGALDERYLYGCAHILHLLARDLIAESYDKIVMLTPTNLKGVIDEENGGEQKNA